MSLPELTERDPRARRGPASFRLVVTAGADAGKDVWVRASTPGPIRIGSSSLCDLVIADRKVSRHHLSLEYQGVRVQLSDLESTNGTRVNDVGVDAVFLEGGEVIRLGDTTLSVEAHTEAAAIELPNQRAFGRIVGASAAMRRLYPVFERLANSDVPTLLEGEPGTGKELLAETLHEMGPRKNQPFITLELPHADPDTLEAALFGVESEGPNGIVVDKGAFEEADGGTLLIDDVAELPLLLQPRVARALERGEITRVNGKEPVAVKVRVLAASSRDLDREVENGNFRENLFYRLAVGRIELPPLRRREGDVALLAGHFWRELDRNDTPFPGDLGLASGHRWPGNVRELRNLVSRRVVMGRTRPMAPEARPEALAEREDRLDMAGLVADDPSFTEARARVIAAFERFFVARTLERHSGNVTKAAAASGLARRYFHKLKSRHRP